VVAEVEILVTECATNVTNLAIWQGNALMDRNKSNVIIVEDMVIIPESVPVKGVIVIAVTTVTTTDVVVEEEEDEVAAENATNVEKGVILQESVPMEVAQETTDVTDVINLVIWQEIVLMNEE